ncbi:GAF domain-containing protein [Arthrobacter sp. Z4-13]
MPQQLPLSELTLVMARIEDLLLTEEKVGRAVQLLAEGIRDAFPGSSGAGVSLLDGQGQRISTGSTDPVVLRADEAQYELGQGPCLTAWATENTVLVQDAAGDDRWPLWARAIAGLPVRSVISAPLLAGTKCLGALKIYSEEPGTYDESTARSLEKLAAPAALLLDNIQGSETPRRFSAVLTTALTSRDSANHAAGILMERHGIGPEQAHQELLRMARATGKPITAVATDVITGRRNSSHD